MPADQLFHLQAQPIRKERYRETHKGQKDKESTKGENKIVLHRASGQSQGADGQKIYPHYKKRERPVKHGLGEIDVCMEKMASKNGYENQKAGHKKGGPVDHFEF